MLNKALNSDQLKISTEIDGAILVLAGAGSGKTRVLISRIQYMIEDIGIKPSNILAITFTNKAANEMKTRLAAVVENAWQMNISTIHSMCTRILRNEAVNLGYDNNFSIYTDIESERVIKRILNTQSFDDDFVKKNVLYQISKAKSLGLSPEEFALEFAFEREIDKIVEIYKSYDKELKKSNAMDFDDLLFNTYKLFKHFPDILDKYQERYKYISIDEFQDTNHVQYEIFKLLSKKYKNIFVVGDDDQSIYGWRGADVTNILGFKKDFPDAKIFKLEQNYRSTKKILTVANLIIDKNSNRYEKKLWTENIEGVRIESYTGYNENDEAYFVVQQIVNLVRHNDYKYSDFAVLMRINALSRVFEQECLKYGIPTRIFGGFKFFERKEIKDILAYLNIIVNCKDTEAIVRIINVPKRGIGDTTIAKLRNIATENDIALYDVLLNEDYLVSFNKGTRTKLCEFKDILLKSKSLNCVDNVVELVENVIEISCIKDSYLNTPEELNHIANINEFVESVREYTTLNPTCGLAEYLQSVALVSDMDKIDNESSVTLATIHSAKGLEFKTVFIVGLDETIFPNSRATFSNAEMDEERRLMYVGITRAMQRLYITRSRSRYLYNERKDLLPSIFFEEIENDIATKKPSYNKDASTKTIVLTAIKDAVEINKIKIGTNVIHKLFGRGVVVSVNNGNGDIAFEGVGIKTLSFKFAPLEIID